MSRKQNLIDIIEGCEKPEFDKVIKEYLKVVYDFSRVVITDGPNDAGMDLRIFDLDGQKNQYQLTIQKSKSAQEKRQFEKKLNEDLIKARENHEKFGYPKSLYFFYSKTLTNKAVREYQRKALIEYGISLTIVEANQIAEEAEEFISIQSVLYEISGLDKFHVGDSIFDDSEKNLLFDLVGFGKPSEFKLQFLESFILQFLFGNGPSSLETIQRSCEEKFKAKENNVFYEKLIARLQTDRKIKKDKDSSTFYLVDEEKDRILNLTNQWSLDERFFVSGIGEILNEFGLSEYLEGIIAQLKKVYIENFSSDIVDVFSSEETSELRVGSSEFLWLLRDKLENKDQTKDVARKLLSFCKDNPFLQKVCAAKVFGERVNVNRIESYLLTQKRVFIDTQLSLYALCYFYNPQKEPKNYFHRTIKSLIEFCRKGKIKLHIPEIYIWETQNHVRDAINLIPFTQLPNFSSLGKSRNVFYNYFLSIESEEGISYTEYLLKFGFRMFDSYKTHNALIEQYLKNLGIEKIEIQERYQIDDAKSIFQSELYLSQRVKTLFGLNNDAKMLEFLGDNDVEVHPMQPIFLSWDKTFFKVKPRFIEKFPASQRWFIFTPSKFIDHYGILNFSINSETITSDLLALISDEFVQSTHHLLDSILVILNPNNEVGLEFTNKLADIRDRDLHRIEESAFSRPHDFEGDAVVDDVFYKLSNHFLKNDRIEDFKKVFLSKDHVEPVIEIILSAINTFHETKKFDESIFSKFDEIIKDIQKKE
jgi:hypothetical protein